MTTQEATQLEQRAKSLSKTVSDLKEHINKMDQKLKELTDLYEGEIKRLRDKLARLN